MLKKTCEINKKKRKEKSSRGFSVFFQEVLWEVKLIFCRFCAEIKIQHHDSLVSNWSDYIVTIEQLIIHLKVMDVFFFISAAKTFLFLRFYRINTDIYRASFSRQTTEMSEFLVALVAKRHSIFGPLWKCAVLLKIVFVS